MMLLLLLIAAALAFYFLPVIIASKRGVTGQGALFTVNLLLGWTLIFWVVCLIWAGCGGTEAQRAYYARAVR